MIRAPLFGLAATLAAIAFPVRALAYPQFQLSKDQTCASCHVSPAGGGLLGENGLAVAEQMSTYGGAPEAAHGKLVGPTWLLVGADFRAGAGLIENTGSHPNAFPMQAEGAAFARHDAWSVYATLGVQQGHNPATYLELREHFVMWQQSPGASEGLYVRAGRFMPVFGLRLAEHNAYTRQFGQTPLYGETYGAAVEYVQAAWEAHVTGFVHDPIQDPVEHGNGAAVYAEGRVNKIASIGIEGRYANSSDDARTAGGITAKYWIAPADLLLQLEGQVIHQSFAAGSSRNQVVSYLMGSWFFHSGWMLDIGLSQFDQDLKVKEIDTEALDANVHWFATSHWELLLTNRIQTIAFGSGGRSSGYALLQFHYRL
ncbi:MAG: hypothetical protein JWO36_2542 [Myxococcales bacterium]|nr:hypothetical protein [Myxococcales bacterium]